MSKQADTKHGLQEKFRVLARRYAIHIVALVCAMSLGGTVAVRLGQDVNYDLLNYHYNNPYSLIRNQSQKQIAVSGILSDENPTRDIPAYLLMSNLSPKKAGFILGALQGINVWILFEIMLMVVSRLRIHRYTKRSIAAIVAGLSLFGAGSLSEVGTTMGDNFTSILVLLSVLFLMRSYVGEKNYKSIGLYRAVAFVSIGVSAGVKLTNVSYVIGLFFAGLLFQRSVRARVKQAATDVSFGTIGLLAGGGFWFARNWSLYGNPIFPFYNGIFKSEFYPETNFVDERWNNAPLVHALLEPFSYFEYQAISSEMFFTDSRVALMLVAVTLLVAGFIVRKKIGTIQTLRSMQESVDEHKRILLPLAVFTLVSYLSWATQFSYYRYIISLELLSLVLIAAAVFMYIRKFWVASVVVVLIFGFIVSTTHHMSWGRVPWQPTNFGVAQSDFDHLEDATVLIAGYTPFSFMLPYFPESTQVIRVTSNLNSPSFGTEKMRQLIQDAVQEGIETGSPFYALRTDEELARAEADFAHYGFRMQGCVEIPVTVRQNIASKYRLCGLEPI